MWINPQESTDLVKFTEEILNGKFHFLCSVKFLIPWEAKKEYVRTKYQRADKRIYKPNWDFIVAFWIMGLRTNQNKTSKSHLEGTEAQFTMGKKNFLLEAKTKIHFGERRIH